MKRINTLGILVFRYIGISVVFGLLSLSEAVFVPALAQSDSTLNRSVTVERDFQPDLCLLCDPGRVQQVAVNMIMNAINFTDSGGFVTVKIHAVEKQNKNKLTITVADSGCGIGARFLPQIFDPFSREKRNPNKYGTGSGLGLTIAKRLAKAMHGDITVESEEDLGSTFTASMVFGG